MPLAFTTGETAAAAAVVVVVAAVLVLELGLSGIHVFIIKISLPQGKKCP